jgi:conjugative transfer region protein (TIGR03748 family)
VIILIDGFCMKKKSVLCASFLALLCGCSSIAAAKSFTEYPSRYTRIDPQVTPSQNNILGYKRKRTFPRKSVKTVGQAMQIWLRGTGYNLASTHPDRNVYQLLQLGLPNVHRTLGTVSIESGLKALAGDPWELVIDPVHRLVSFSLPAGYTQPMLVTSSVVDVRTDSAGRSIKTSGGRNSAPKYVERGAMLKSASTRSRKVKKRCFIFCHAKSTLELIY